MSTPSLTTIYVTRHGFRSNWTVNHTTGEYSSSVKTPTGIPSDPSLAGHGEKQAEELAAHLSTLSPPIERIYSSPYYRCLQTISPLLPLLPARLSLRGEHGIGEWYGLATFSHPSPASPSLLQTFFPAYDMTYKPHIKASEKGETIEQLHERVAYALHKIIEECDRDGVKTIVICTHAATLIALGRVLVGRMPQDVGEQDFSPFTCGLSTFERRTQGAGIAEEVKDWEGKGTEVPRVEWRGGKGVGGGWEVKGNGECDFLSGGEERGWRFSGDESFLVKFEEAPALDAASGLGVVVEGKKKHKGTTDPPKL